MDISIEQGKLILDLVREYRVRRDEMTSPLNPDRATHLQFIVFCNERAGQLRKLLPTATYDETLHLYLLTSKQVSGLRADRVWADYTTADEEAVTELLGLMLGLIRQERDGS